MKPLLKTSNEKRYSLSEYFALETANRETKYEHLDGEIVAMAGAQPEHNSICANLIREIGNRIIKQKKPVGYIQATSKSKAKRRQAAKLVTFILMCRWCVASLNFQTTILKRC